MGNAMRMFRYVAWIYLKYFFIIAFALSFLFAGLDYLQHLGSKLNGFNIKVLYLFYKGSYALDLLFPLALVFAMIAAKVVLIRSNALLSFYALGYSKKQVLTPFIAVSFFLTLLYVGMHFSSFVDADLSARALLHGKRVENIKRNLFLKYNESFIYIGQLVPAKKEAQDIRIYRMTEKELVQMIYGQKAIFKGDRWIVKDAKIVFKPTPKKLGGKGFSVEHKESYETLFGFKPKILTSVFQGKKYYTIQDAYEAFRLLASQGLDTQRVRTLFYHMAVTPFFALFLVIIFFLSIPPYARSVNLLLTSFVLTGTTLFVWGILYLLYRISQTGVILPEMGMVLIVFLLGIGALYSYLVRTNR
ncbi:LptF/LptG family permease [Hydrogenimonas urashimensis]|uniref:LptF/LptG family permease n=1 Tax=Hydrogenimonas urashimensis TaxID=2740515 RepID=UPI001914F948|nr:LptF/LptG family permease [Hydrogenimonas urashimensis]